MQFWTMCFHWEEMKFLSSDCESLEYDFIVTDEREQLPSQVLRKLILDLGLCPHPGP